MDKELKTETERQDFEALYNELKQQLIVYQNYTNNLETTIRVLANLLNK